MLELTCSLTSMQTSVFEPPAAEHIRLSFCPEEIVQLRQEYGCAL